MKPVPRLKKTTVWRHLHVRAALVAAPLTTVAYAILSVGVLVRSLSPLATGWYLTLIDVAAAAWLVAFGLFTVVYWPILTQPRKP